jgi:intracellular sulfur oxidation DsrE/DsrF family protein
MKLHVMTSLLVVTGLAFTAASDRPGEKPRLAAPAEPATLKAVVHVNFSDAERQKAGLRNVSNILKAENDATVEVVCHGGGIELLVKEKSRHAADVEQLSKRGVRFAACENTMREKAITKEQLLPGVVTVPSGAVEVIRKQQEGYGYFKP